MRSKLGLVVAAIFLLCCVQQSLLSGGNLVSNCQCHEEPWKYEKHYANLTSCKSCHGNEILPYHKSLADWKWENVAEVSCTLCHDPSLLANHGGKCETCHKSIKETHEKFLQKYIKR
jgi:hypothetical protein